MSQDTRLKAFVRQFSRKAVYSPRFLKQGLHLSIMSFVLISSSLQAEVSQHATKEASKSYAKESLLEIEPGYIRGLPPGQKTTAAFFSLTNKSDKTLKLERLYSDVAEKVELHETRNVGGTMQMRKLEQFSIKPQETVHFESGAKHLMLIGLKRNLKAGEQIDLSLCFDQACQLVSLDVMSVLDEAEAGEHQHHHH